MGRGAPPGRSGVLTGWSGLALLRLGLAVAIGVYAWTYRPQLGYPEPSYVGLAALAIAASLALLAFVQFAPRNRWSHRIALICLAVDALAVLGTLALYSFDPRRLLFALVVVVQAEAGVVLGVSGGLTVWAATSLGYIGVEFLAARVAGWAIEPIEVAVRVGAGMLLALGGGFLSDELSGERELRVAERERELRRLQEAEARYRSLVEQIPVVTYIDAVDRTSSTIFVSPQIEEVTGYTTAEWVADPELWTKLIHADDRARVLAEHERTNATGDPFKAEYRLIARDGRVVWVYDEAIQVRDDVGHKLYWQGVMVDITERKRAEEEVTFLAYHDKLTGLPNRLMFERVLDIALARARRRGLAVAVLYMDLDNFKEVNDTLGHAMGDQVLGRIAQRLTAAVRATDVVARQGGDEFLILLADLDREGGGLALGALALAEAVSERIHDALKAPFEVGSHVFRITASIGVSYFPVSADDADGLLKMADEAMYRSKRMAPGETVFAEDG